MCFINISDPDEVTYLGTEFEITCSKGTYIRSLARDMGTSLGNGAHLIQLTRTAVGEIQLEAVCSAQMRRESEGREGWRGEMSTRVQA